MTEATGVLLIAVGGYALLRPLSIRTFPTAKEWKTNPDKAEQEQRAYATLVAMSAILGGLILIGMGVFGSAP